MTENLSVKEKLRREDLEERRPVWDFPFTRGEADFILKGVKAARTGLVMTSADRGYWYVAFVNSQDETMRVKEGSALLEHLEWFPKPNQYRLVDFKNQGATLLYKNARQNIINRIKEIDEFDFINAKDLEEFKRLKRKFEGIVL